MDRAELQQAMGDASRPSRPVERSSPTSSAEHLERTRMFAKLFTLYPFVTSQDSEGALLAYLEETRDIPVRWLSRGLAQIVREPSRRFAPSVGEIRGAALLLIRAARRLAEGKPATMYSPHGESPLRPERELAWANGGEPKRLTESKP